MHSGWDTGREFKLKKKQTNLAVLDKKRVFHVADNIMFARRDYKHELTQQETATWTMQRYDGNMSWTFILQKVRTVSVHL